MVFNIIMLGHYQCHSSTSHFLCCDLFSCVPPFFPSACLQFLVGVPPLGPPCVGEQLEMGMPWGQWDIGGAACACRAGGVEIKKAEGEKGPGAF